MFDEETIWKQCQRLYFLPQDRGTPQHQASSDLSQSLSQCNPASMDSILHTKHKLTPVQSFVFPVTISNL